MVSRASCSLGFLQLRIHDLRLLNGERTTKTHPSVPDGNVLVQLGRIHPAPIPVPQRASGRGQPPTEIPALHPSWYPPYLPERSVQFFVIKGPTGVPTYFGRTVRSNRLLHHLPPARRHAVRGSADRTPGLWGGLSHV